MKHLDVKLGVVSIVLVIVGYFLYPITEALWPTADWDVAQIVGLLLVFVVGGLGVAFGIASIFVLILRLRER